jgi:hypothetical protein
MNIQNSLVNDGWTNAYQKYLEQYHQNNGERHPENRMQPEGLVNKKFIEESHNLFFFNAFNTIEAKRPVQNIYKRPI